MEDTCFGGDTLVHVEEYTLSGLRYDLLEIQFVGVGDKVLSRCEETGEIAYREVVKKFKHDDIPTYWLSYYGNSNNRDKLAFSIEVTAEHRFWVEGKGWTTTIDLQPGDVMGSCDGAPLTVNAVHPTGDNVEVYNLTVADFHTYFVGLEGVWVHNTKAVEGSPSVGLVKACPSPGVSTTEPP